MVASTLWALFSVVCVALAANRVWDGVRGRFGDLSGLVGPTTRPLPSPPAGMDTAAPVPAVDPRPAAAAAWNSSTEAYGRGDFSQSCRVYAFGSTYMFANQFECSTSLRSYSDDEGLHDRTLEGRSRIAPEDLVVLADGSVAFVNSAVVWPDGPPDAWDPRQDRSVQVLHQFSGRGWLQVGYLNSQGDAKGYVPEPLPPSLRP